MGYIWSKSLALSYFIFSSDNNDTSANKRCIINSHFLFVEVCTDFTMIVYFDECVQKLDRSIFKILSWQSRCCDTPPVFHISSQISTYHLSSNWIVEVHHFTMVSFKLNLFFACVYSLGFLQNTHLLQSSINQYLTKYLN